eukprot:COSAG02_NODE_1428_length_12662_cov_12.695137_7_plen_814_part_00
MSGELPGLIDTQSAVESSAVRGHLVRDRHVAVYRPSSAEVTPEEEIEIVRLVPSEVGPRRVWPEGGETTATADRGVVPSLEHIEERGVSAAFLQHLVDTRLGDKRLAKDASIAAAGHLQERIERVKGEIARVQTRASEERRGAKAAQGSDARQRRVVAGQAERELLVLERGLRQHEKDLAWRETKPYLTARDVHKLLVVKETEERMVRYVELPGVCDGFDSETGKCFVGQAQYFFSYSWDSPWEDVVGALVAHSARIVEAGRPPPYYWIDIFAVNQHTRDAAVNGHAVCGACEECRKNSLCPPCPACAASYCNGCPGCAAVWKDMHDWSRPVGHPAKGFERVIKHVKHTLVLNEPLDNPRPPTRVWCLFEGYTTLACHGKLEVVLAPRHHDDLQLSLEKQFAYLQAYVSGIDSRLAEATVEQDRTNIFASIERLEGGFERLNDKMQKAHWRWLAETADGMLSRTEPSKLRERCSRWCALCQAANAAATHAELATKVGWLWLRLGEAKAAEKIFRAAHEKVQRMVGTDDSEHSYIVAPGLTRSLCELDRPKAEALLAEVKAATERSARNGCTRQRNLNFGSECLGFVRASGWKRRGPMLRARMAAAARLPDAEVLALLTEAGKTKFGEKYCLSDNEPEWAELRARMAPDGEGTAEDRAVWQALPQLMRSAGDNALSPWVKYTHNGRSYYKHDNRKYATLRKPSVLEGVRQEAEVDMPGLALTADQWESNYFRLGGPDRWTLQQYETYLYRQRILRCKCTGASELVPPVPPDWFLWCLQCVVSPMCFCILIILIIICCIIIIAIWAEWVLANVPN